MDVLILILVSICLGAVGQISLKYGMNNLGNFEVSYFFTSRIFDLLKEKFVMAGIFLYALSTILWLSILSKAELSFAYPLIAAGYVVVAILSKFIFNDNLGLGRLGGIILIIIGVILIVSKI